MNLRPTLPTLSPCENGPEIHAYCHGILYITDYTTMKYRYRVLGRLSLLFRITYLDRICISIAGPRMQKDLNIGPEMWGWAISAFTLAYARFEIPSGMMGDTHLPAKGP